MAKIVSNAFVMRWTFLMLALVTSVRSFQRFPIHEDNILDQFVEERNHFRSVASPVVMRDNNEAPRMPPFNPDVRPQRPRLHNNTEVRMVVGDSAPSGSHVMVAKATPAPSDDSHQEESQSSYATIPGKSGVDYPLLTHVPLTNFYCYNQKHPGYYADPETGCQVFHVCNLDGRQDSFLCPPGTVFNQPYFVCDWWFNVDCRQAPKYYSLNRELHMTVQPVQAMSGKQDVVEGSRVQDNANWDDGSRDRGRNRS